MRNAAPLVVVVVLAIAVPAQAQTAATPGLITSYSTIHSIGVEWDITGDDDHDASVTIRYRAAGAPSWKQALNLIRVDSTPPDPREGLTSARNMLAGSIFFLQPNTQYDVELVLSDPDGGLATQVISLTTRHLPIKPTGGNTYHVVPGTGGGNGSSGNPFQGIAAAQAVAVAKDRMLLHAGTYGDASFTKAGNANGDYIVWEAAGDGEATFGVVTVAASHLWLEGLTVRNQDTGLVTSGSRTDVVITRSSFQNNHDAISLGGGTPTFWYIADNDMVGDTDPAGGSFSGEGIDLRHSSGHTLAHNRITFVADGISYPLSNIDIFGNDIFTTSDDCIELDYGYSNVRVWKNRCHKAGLHNGIAFQPQNMGPAYLIRNQIVISTDEGPMKLKINNTDRVVLMHNTLVNILNNEFQNNASEMLRFYSRNNLFIAGSAAGGQIWNQGGVAADWRSNLNYDGFNWGTFSGNPFVYLGTGRATVSAYAAASGQENNGFQVVQTNTFESTSYDSTPRPVLALKTGATAIDSGEALPNINDDFVGAAPDLGAHEFGASSMQYGPRAEIVACADGATRSCYTGPSASQGQGECQVGSQTCAAGVWGACAGEVLPSSENCDDALDNNCDGSVNDGCACTGSASQPCYGGAANTSEVGACHAGTQACVAGQWGACVDQVLPSTEECDDGVDGDCDGALDHEDDDCAPAEEAPAEGGMIVRGGCACGSAPPGVAFCLGAALTLARIRGLRRTKA